MGNSPSGDPEWVAIGWGLNRSLWVNGVKVWLACHEVTIRTGMDLFSPWIVVPAPFTSVLGLGFGPPQ